MPAWLHADIILGGALSGLRSAASARAQSRRSLLSACLQLQPALALERPCHARACAMMPRPPSCPRLAGASTGGQRGRVLPPAWSCAVHAPPPCRLRQLDADADSGVQPALPHPAPPPRPVCAAGTLLLFDQEECRDYRRDGYRWKKVKVKYTLKGGAGAGAHGAGEGLAAGGPIETQGDAALLA